MLFEPRREESWFRLARSPVRDNTDRYRRAG